MSQKRKSHQMASNFNPLFQTLVPMEDSETDRCSQQEFEMLNKRHKSSGTVDNSMASPSATLKSAECGGSHPDTLSPQSIRELVSPEVWIDLQDSTPTTILEDTNLTFKTSKTMEVGEHASTDATDDVDNTSDITITNDPIVAQPQLASLPTEIQQKIFKHVLVRKRYVIVRYASSMLVNSVSCYTLDDEPVNTLENIDAGPLLISKHINAMVSVILYSQNYFLLDDAEISWWWFKKIGKTNFSNLRLLAIALNCDRPLPARLISCFVNYHEEIWYRCFAYIKQANASLDSLVIDLRWGTNGLPPGRKTAHEQMIWRKAILDKITQLRDIKELQIYQPAGCFIDDREIRDLKMITRQPRRTHNNTTIASSAKPDISLSALIQEIRFNRLEREAIQIAARHGWGQDGGCRSFHPGGRSRHMKRF